MTIGWHLLELPALSACAAALEADGVYVGQWMVSRPIIPFGQDIGYLPGAKEEKLHAWMQPIFDNLAFILSSKKTGGNGTIEEFTALPRLLRDSVVCEAWEGGHGVLCAQDLGEALGWGGGRDVEDDAENGQQGTDPHVAHHHAASLTLAFG